MIKGFGSSGGGPPGGTPSKLLSLLPYGARLRLS